MAGSKANLLSYNGQVPAPRLEVRAGDAEGGSQSDHRVRIRFTNNLSQPTNLHFHGLHVTPTGNGDNPFLTIPPQRV
nr:multicopper oxidase domain-containing protein [Chroococcidiopsis sp. CCALA 051]